MTPVQGQEQDTERMLNVFLAAFNLDLCKICAHKNKYVINSPQKMKFTT